MKCPRCKKQLRKGAKFCPACGTRIEKKQKIRFTHILLIISILLGIIAIGWGGGILLAKISSTGTIKLDSKTIREAKIKVEDVTNIMDAAIDTYTDNEGYISIDAQNVALESISAQAEALFDSGKITDYSYNAGDSGIYFEIDNWLSVLYVPPIKDFMSNGDDTIEVVTLEPSAASWYLNYATSGFKGPDEAATCIIENISNFSFTQDLEDYEVSIETFVNLPKNAIVIFNGHGGCNSRIGSVLFTGVNAWDEDAMNQYSDAIANQAIGINQEGKFYLTSRFFDNYVADNAYSGNLFYLGSCSSCADPRLAQSLWDKGARAIIGNSNTVWVNYNFQMTYSFFEGLTTKDDSGQYLPVTKALEYAKNKHGAQDSFGYGSEVLACYRDDFTLVDMIDAKKYEDALVVKVTDPPVSDVYETYISAAKNTIKDGSWSEHLVMTANMAITDGSAKTKTKVTLTSDADVSNYSESDPSQIRMSGSAEMTVMGQTYAWDMDYENGTAHYRYTKPNQTSADMKIDPSFFNFDTMTSDMMTNAKLSGNKITFTVPSEKIAEVGIAAVNQMSGVDNLEYGDVGVTVTISNEGKIDNIVMIFHASLEYQGYDADVDYNIDYRFFDSTSISDKPASSSLPIVTGIYAQDGSDYNTLTVHETDGQTIEFTAFWYRIADIYHAIAEVNGNNGASFEYIGPDVNWQAAGTLQFPSENTIILTISASSHEYINTGEYRYSLIGKFFSDEELRAISAALNVPGNLDTQITQGEPGYWEGGRIYRTPIEIYYNGELIAGASVNSLTGELAGAIYTYSGHTEAVSGLSEEDAYAIACKYWNYTENAVHEETGYELTVTSDGLIESGDGNVYYAFRLRWLVPANGTTSTLEYLYVNEKTGECKYTIDY